MCVEVGVLYCQNHRIWVWVWFFGFSSVPVRIPIAFLVWLGFLALPGLWLVFVLSKSVSVGGSFFVVWALSCFFPGFVLGLVGVLGRVWLQLWSRYKYHFQLDSCLQRVHVFMRSIFPECLYYHWVPVLRSVFLQT